jgi:serine/threonine-protein kinase
MSQTIEHNERLADVVASALELQAAERAAFLAAACGGNEELRRASEFLLAAHDSGDAFMQRPAPELVATELAADVLLDEAAPASHIGPYKIIERIAQGGMGAVWLAARDDAEFAQRVALKVIRRGMDHASIIRRFRHERQILARLEHPYIARLLDGGTTAEGLPWFALEYIAGERLTEAQRLPLRARLPLFLKVCEAVQYAHRHLVIHRDLKPSNILVTADGAPKLLDFGIAKLLHPDRPEDTLELTLAGTQPLTLAYAAPEQVRDGDITTATDIYALGVILYELLTGRRPYRLATLAPREIERVVCEVESPKLSLAVASASAERSGPPPPEAPERLARLLRGDLDNIVLTALRKEPERRYASVEQLSEDLRRHLAGRVVGATPDTWRYRAGKFVRRNKTLALVSALFIVALLSVAAAALWQARVAGRNAARAEQQRTKAERISSYLQNVFSYAEPNASFRGGGRSPDVKLEEALRDAETRLVNELKDQPEIKADLYITLGKVWQMRGVYAAAKRDFQQALALRRQLHGERHVEVARCLIFVNLAHHHLDEPEEGDPLGMLLELDPENDRLAWMITGRAVGYASAGDFAKADEWFRDATQRFHQKFGTTHIYNVYALTRHAESFMQRGELERAEQLLQQSFDLMRQAPPDAETGNATTSAGLLEMARGNDTAAEKTLREALRLFDQYLGADYPLSIYAWFHLTVLYGQRRDFTQAEQAARRALRIAETKYPPAHPLQIEALSRLSVALFAAGQPQAAAPYWQTAREHYHKLRDIPPEVVSPDAALTVAGLLGEALTLRKEYAEAECLLRESYEGFQPIRGARSPDLTQARRRLARLYDDWGKPEQAAQFR